MPSSRSSSTRGQTGQIEPPDSTMGARDRRDFSSNRVHARMASRRASNGGSQAVRMQVGTAGQTLGGWRDARDADDEFGWHRDALTPRCSSTGATVPWTPGTSCSRSASSVRPCPWWRVHWDPWLQPHPPGRNQERNSACASTGKSIGLRLLSGGLPVTRAFHLS